MYIKKNTGGILHYIILPNSFDQWVINSQKVSISSQHTSRLASTREKCFLADSQYSTKGIEIGNIFHTTVAFDQPRGTFNFSYLAPQANFRVCSGLHLVILHSLTGDACTINDRNNRTTSGISENNGRIRVFFPPFLSFKNMCNVT